ncbi:acyltransferase family protein [Butyrivibrio sp. FCS006]|uniref:acyltransferase family protein n=1 Tax=Butyrivibrio sp. FCS006 TaxID=1280684 RepID=UPI00042188A3|nr:acyltransferase [Butyrivibrio sp. FCS006]
MNYIRQSETTRQRIDSLQALRALAFLGIFFSHADFFISWPKLGVSIFYVMSGFLMTYRYENVELVESFKNNLCFSLKKIKKLYPLHIITMILVILIHLASVLGGGISIGEIIALLVQIALNVTLLQTWVPNSSFNVSLNGVAWYLSVTLFLYFMFPWIKKVIEQTTIIKLSIICGIILCLEIVTCILFIFVYGIDSPVYVWFMYCFPVFRMGDFFIGCVLKRLFFESNVRSIGMLEATIFEVLAVVITVFVFHWLEIEPDSIVLQALHNRTTIYIPLALIWVLLFAASKGLITTVLSNKLMVFIGNISAYAFLIHYVITTFTSRLLSYLNVSVNGWNRVLLVFAELVVTILLSMIYKLFHEKFLSR